MTEREVLYAVEEGIATITLNRPHRKNGITPELVEQLIACLTAIPNDSAVRAVILTGAEDAFCSGMDLSVPIPADESAFLRRVGEACVLLHSLPLPTIARVQGAAVGFGANLALCCDLVLAGRSALFGEVFAERGLSVDGGGSWLLPRLVGPALAKEILFFGQRIDGESALAIGLVNRCVPDDELDALVLDWAGRLVRGPRRAYASMKGLVNGSWERSFASSVEAEAVAQALAFRSPEVAAGMRAYRKKEQADFSEV